MTAISAMFLVLALSIGSPAAALAGQGDCGQPVSTGTGSVASDCLFMLNVAVGIGACDPECICELSGAPPVTSTDALLCLNVAVGSIAQPACPCTTTTSSTTTTIKPGPLACGDAEVPSCNGTCGINEACIVGIDGCSCSSLACGDVETAPQCSGLCPTGSRCAIDGNGCQCVPGATTCEIAGAPGCDGDCPSGSFCGFDTGSGRCLCEATGCGDIAGAPTCLGVCPPTFTCEQSGEFLCACVQ